VSARSYLSIGDVLTLLRQEFPDITISKIRFLESQGLVNPERTPSGYRKFYEHDVERLRWVLRQQREHFLPLKVIKDRLDDGSEAADAEAEPSPAAGDATTSVNHDRPADAADDARDPVLVGQRVGADAEARANPVASHPTGDPPLTLVGEGSGLPGMGSAGDGDREGSAPDTTSTRGSPTASRATTRSASSHRRGTDRAPLLELVDDGGSPGSRVTAADPASHSGGGAPAGARAGVPTTGTAASGTAATGSAARRAKPTAASPTEPGDKGGPGDAAGAADSAPSTPSGSSGSPRGAKGSPKAGARAPATPSAPGSTPGSPPGSSPGPTAGSKTASSGGSGVSLSAEDLAAACGLDLAILRELQEYGLLVAGTVAGVEYFDEEALAVATVAAGFTRYGIEPRHLRLYKNAAEREAGFVEQVVLPLVRQRNPEARARAQETAEELTQLGQQLRGSLLRSALGNLLNS
jgi:DNA-binding transcriptional MerR regulator